MQGFSVTQPDPQPIRHARHFSTDEIIAALCEYLKGNGVAVPDGDKCLYGLERARQGEEESLTLVIDVEAGA